MSGLLGICWRSPRAVITSRLAAESAASKEAAATAAGMLWLLSITIEETALVPTALTLTVRLGEITVVSRAASMVSDHGVERGAGGKTDVTPIPRSQLSDRGPGSVVNTSSLDLGGAFGSKTVRLGVVSIQPRTDVGSGVV